MRVSFRQPMLVILSIALSVPSLASAVPVTFSASGPNAASIQATVDSFRTALGGVNNGNAPGPLITGRREINWDGGGAVTPTVTGTPLTAFENIRGAIFTTTGTGFIQGSPADLATQFGNATYATTFTTFSPLRLFTPIGTNRTDGGFSIPGTAGSVPASVSGFGAVFADVDLANTTSIQYFDLNNASLGTFFAPTNPVGVDNGLSFLGIFFNAGEQISRVRIFTGNSALGPNANDGGGVDVVVMDDFIYGEPHNPIPEPTSLLLLGTGLLGLIIWNNHRRILALARVR